MIAMSMLRLLGAFVLALVMAPGSELAASEAEPKVLELRQSGDVLARYSDAVVTQTDFDAFLQGIPLRDRSAFLRSPERVEDTLVNMLIGQRALAMAAQNGLLAEELFQGRVLLEAGKIAVESLRNAYLDQYMLDDYTELARELFISRREDFAAEGTVDFAHVIVAAEIDGDPTRGMRDILDLYDAAVERADLRTLAIEIGQSDDPHRAGGDHKAITVSQLEPNIASHLRLMQPGEISEPIRTESGWHVVQLNAVHGRAPRDFEEVREEAIEVARSRHQDALLGRFRAELMSGDIQLPEGAIRDLLSRHGVTWSREEN